MTSRSYKAPYNRSLLFILYPAFNKRAKRKKTNKQILYTIDAMSIIEEETQWLRSTILPKILKDGRLVDNYSDAKAGTFKLGDIKIDVIGHAEAFMLTFCYRTTINFEFDGEKLQRKMVVKKTPKVPPEMYDSIQFGPLFTNEINFYTKILPEIQKVAGGKFAAPKYYYSELNRHSAVIILEDFAERGWRVTKDRVGLSLEHALIAVEYLGQFHGFTYAIKHKNPEQFGQLTSELKESRYARDEINHEWNLTIQTGVKRAAKAVATYQPQIKEEFVRKLCFLMWDYVLYGKQRVAPREPLATLCHGDYVRNNVAYKYRDQPEEIFSTQVVDGQIVRTLLGINNNPPEEPLEIMMFDYQTLRVSSPMIDLAVFLAISLYADVRYKNFDAIFERYCFSLYGSYTKHTKGSTIPDFMSHAELLKEYVRFLPYSVSITASFLMSLVEPLDMSPEEMFSQQLTDEEIIERVMNQGGEVVNREVAHQIKEMLELSQRVGVAIDDGIDVDQLPKVKESYN
ncbi:uncharacterized protein LOC110179729 [Drosophila serrata]|uniref:uncharacterized protein LOC110179729 n=1 Tax=Drosophila serrata TaxID=7274 RepID=UPI000A1CFCFD|nr:uncharacterized protein LOC110179729 [Drosophila serrata]